MIMEISAIAVAAANIVSTFFIAKFLRVSSPLLRSIDRSLRTLKTDTLLQRLERSRSRAEVNRGLFTICDEDMLEMIPHKTIREFLIRVGEKPARNKENI